MTLAVLVILIPLRLLHMLLFDLHEMLFNQDGLLVEMLAERNCRVQSERQRCLRKLNTD